MGTGKISRLERELEKAEKQILILRKELPTEDTDFNYRTIETHMQKDGAIPLPRGAWLHIPVFDRYHGELVVIRESENCIQIRSNAHTNVSIELSSSNNFYVTVKGG